MAEHRWIDPFAVHLTIVLDCFATMFGFKTRGTPYISALIPRPGTRAPKPLRQFCHPLGYASMVAAFFDTFEIDVRGIHTMVSPGWPVFRHPQAHERQTGS